MTMDDIQDEIVPIPEDLVQDDVLEQDDGSALVSFAEDEDVLLSVFDANLAESIPESELQDLASSLLDSVEHDLEARKRRDEQYEEGIRRTGLGDDAPGGAKFSGASKVVHPVMAEACIDFSARAMKELFPANGPVKMETDGLVPPETEHQIKALAKCLNDQFRFRIPEYRSVQEQELTQLPLGGSQYMKFSVDRTKNKVAVEFVPIDDLILPYAAASFYTAERFTHRQYITHDTYKARVADGTYRDLDAIKAALEPELSAAAEANTKIEGKESSGYNEDGLRAIYEVYLEYEFEADTFSGGKRSPYIVCIDEYEQKVLSIYRNWDQNDTLRTRLDWISEDIFIPWRGAQGIGLPHLIGGLSGAATGALRALLDSAHINNAPTLLKLKGSRMNGTTQSVNVTQIVDIEGPVGIDDIRKYLMPMPFNAPSPVLFQLLGWLTDAAKGVVSTASEKIADATSNTPVGTVQALIEQGAVIFSSIHSRLHFSQVKKFEIVLRILKTYFPEVLQEYGLDPKIVSAKDIHPVSDPQIFSEAQRFAQAQGVLQLAEKAEATKPGLYNLREAHRQMLTLMKVQNIDAILPPVPQPQPADVATEMVSFVTGKPTIVVPEMDHPSHILAHVAYLKNPMGGLNPIMVTITAKVLEHLRDHLALFMAQRMSGSVMQMQQQAQQQAAYAQQQAAYAAQMGIPMPVETPQLPPPDQVMAQAAMDSVMQDMTLAQEALEVIKMADQFVRETMMAQSPDMAMVKVQAEAQHKALEAQIEKDRQNLEIKLIEQQRRHEQQVFDQQLATQKQFVDEMVKRTELQQNGIAVQLEQTVEMLNNRMDNHQKQITELLKNHDDNRTKLLTEQIKAMMVDLKPVEQPIDDKSYIKDLEGLISRAQSANMSDQLGLIMEGLNETIRAARAPRKTTALRDDAGALIGARSEIDADTE